MRYGATRSLITWIHFSWSWPGRSLPASREARYGDGAFFSLSFEENFSPLVGLQLEPFNIFTLELAGLTQ